MDIDLILDARASADELAGLGQLAEKFGFRGIWVSSLLDSRDPFANLSVLARSTKRILMGPVAVNPYDMHPVRISTAFFTLNELSDGRARIVIGGGGEALASLGLEPKRRVRAVRECIEIIKGAASGQRMNYKGQMFQAAGYGLDWLTKPTPPVFAAANMEQMLRMSAHTADGIMLSDLPAGLTAATLASVAETLRESGREVDDFWSGAFAAWHVYEDEQQAKHEAYQWLLLRGLFRPWVLREFLSEADSDIVMSHQQSFLNAFLEKSHVIEGVPERVLDSLVDQLTLTGTFSRIDKQIDELGRYRDAGLQSISLRLYANPAESIRLIGERVLPELH